MRPRTTSSAALAGAVLLAVAVPAPASARESGTQELTIVVVQDFGAPQPAFSRVVASGVVNGVGRDVFRPSGEDDHNSYSRYVFRAGSLSITTTPTSFDVRPQGSSCVATFTATGTWAVTGGTGAYREATGHGTLTVQGVLVSARTPDGCSETDGTSTGIIRETGHVSLPDDAVPGRAARR
jgi:hypothetical protein